MKPIEPGCLALIVAGECTGTVVTAVRRVTSDEIVHGYQAGRDGWLVEAGNDIGVFADWGLMRIDGDESVTTEAREEISA